MTIQELINVLETFPNKQLTVTNYNSKEIVDTKLAINIFTGHSSLQLLTEKERKKNG